MSFYNLVGALVFLGLGIARCWRWSIAPLYPALRWRYEKAKITQTQGLDPKRLMTAVKFQSLVLHAAHRPVSRRQHETILG